MKQITQRQLTERIEREVSKQLNESNVYKDVNKKTLLQLEKNIQQVINELSDKYKNDEIKQFIIETFNSII